MRTKRRTRGGGSDNELRGTRTTTTLRGSDDDYEIYNEEVSLIRVLQAFIILTRSLRSSSSSQLPRFEQVQPMGFDVWRR